MKVYIFALVLALTPLSLMAAQTDYLLQIPGVDGESTEAASSDQQELDARQTTTDTEKKGNVEYGWKVEEGESTPGVEPDEIDSNSEQEGQTDALLEIKGIEGESRAGVNVAAGDVNGDGLESEGVEPDEIDFDNSQKSNFAILLSSGGSDGDNEQGQRAAEVLEILKDGLDEEGVASEQISLNFEKITTKVKQEVKLFGIIPIQATATVEIDGEENIKVKFPWWAVLASGKDSDNLGQKIFTALSNVLNTKHDEVMNAINNVR